MVCHTCNVKLLPFVIYACSDLIPWLRPSDLVAAGGLDETSQILQFCLSAESDPGGEPEFRMCT